MWDRKPPQAKRYTDGEQASGVKEKMGCSGNVEHCRNLAHLESKVVEA